MPDKTYDILIDIQARVAALDGAIGKIQQLNTATNNVAGNVANAGNAAANSIGRLTPLLTGLIAGFGIGFTNVFIAFGQAALHAGDSLRALSAEQLKVAIEFDKQVTKFITLAKTATSITDVTALGEGIVASLDKAIQRMDELGTKSRTVFQFLADQALAGPVGFGQTIFAAANDAARAASEEELRKRLLNFHALTDIANETAVAFARIKTEPVAQGIAEVTARVTDLKSQAATLYQQSLFPKDATPDQLKKATEAAAQFIAKSTELNVWIKLLEELRKAAAKVTDELQRAAFATTAAAQDVSNQIRENLAIARGDEAGALEARLDALRKSAFNKLLSPSGTNAVEAARQAEQFVASERQRLQAEEANRTATEGERDARRDIVTFLREESALLAASRQREQLIEGNSLLSEGEKNAQLAQIIAEQIDLINQKIGEGRDRLAGGALDPETYAQVSRAVQDLQFQADLLNQKLSGTSFVGQLQAQFAALGSQLQLTGAKIGEVLTGSLRTAINGVSQGITGLITGTNTWGQAMRQTLGAVIGQFIQLGVETAAYYTGLLIKWAIAKSAASAHRAADVTEHVAAEGVKAGASGISALLTSISSFGFAAIVGLAAVVAAIAYFASSGFAAGGYTGDGGTRQVAGIVHAGEFVMNAAATRVLGPENLYALQSAATGKIDLDNLTFVSRAPGYAAGGLVTGDSSFGGSAGVSLPRPVVNQALFLDMNEAKKWLRDREGDNYIVNLINSRGGNGGRP